MKQWFLGLMAAAVSSAGVASTPHPGTEAFLDRAEKEYGLDRATVQAVLSEARFQQSIVDAMTRPAEAKPWYDYRPIFLTDERIQGGIEFWRQNQDLIARAAAAYQVDPQVIVAIIGVETFYGRITGSYRVIDALATLGFHYPEALKRDRSDFFAGEFLQFMVLGQEEHLPLTEVTGSYAGAMGMGQFIPSSYRAYAVDFDDSGNRDLWRSTPDVVASVANYLHQHGWQQGEPVASPARRAESADPSYVAKGQYKPAYTLAELAEAGFSEAGVPGVMRMEPGRKAAVVELEEKDQDAYWLVFDNFYVITRYNRSPLYAMAVYQLSEEIAAGMQE